MSVSKTVIIDKDRTRDFGADAVRIAAVIMVLTLHLFLRNGFYHREMSDIREIPAITVRTISMSSVPLFIMLSGYLKCRKQWSERYYYSLIPILISYMLISVLHLFYKIYFQGEKAGVDEWLLQFLGFDLAEYGWYVGMYIGLFLLIPLLNRTWNGCTSIKEHLAIVLTMCAVTFLPVSVNMLLDAKEDLLPAYFTKLYYITYYFIGCFIRTYRPKIRQWILWTVILLTAVFLSFINVNTRIDPADFYSGFHVSYDHLFTALLTTCTFLSLYQLDCRSLRIRKTAACISNIVFEIYLCSYMPDHIIYSFFDRSSPVYIALPEGILMIASVFILSAIIARPVKAASTWLYQKII